MTDRIKQETLSSRNHLADFLPGALRQPATCEGLGKLSTLLGMILEQMNKRHTEAARVSLASLQVWATA